jgi:hypothetical protein
MSSIVATYPRSGKTFLVSLVANNTFIHLPYTHLHEGETIDILQNYKNIITVVRDPIESISSLLAMEYTYYPHIQQLYKEDLNTLIETKIKQRIAEYEFFYTNIFDYANIVLDFNELIKNPRIKIIKLANKINLNIKVDNYSDPVKDLPDNNFLKTSRDQEIYKEFKEILKTQDLSNCYRLFNKSLNFINI